jgi:hypothetical protein
MAETPTGIITSAFEGAGAFACSVVSAKLMG